MKRLQKLITLNLLFSFAGCIPNQPLVIDCIFDANARAFHCVDSKKKKKDLSVSMADGYICRSPSDFQINRQYELDLQKHAASCDKNIPEKAAVIDCIVDSVSVLAHCSEGSAPAKTYSLLELDNYICRSSLDDSLRIQYRLDLKEWILSGCH